MDELVEKRIFIPRAKLLKAKTTLDAEEVPTKGRMFYNPETDRVENVDDIEEDG